MNTKPTSIPLRLELEYMLDQRRLMRDLSFLTVASLQTRKDSDELLTLIGLSAPEIFNETKLRRRLRQIANRMTDEKLAELARLLGRTVQRPFPGLINQWIDGQVLAVQATIEAWLTTASEEILRSRIKGMAFADMTIAIRERAKNVGFVAEQRASAAILQLNSALIEEIAKSGGSTHYRWTTMDDDRVRPNHAALHFKIQAWNNPPSGGGTKSGDIGHPGSGYGCRCLAIPLQGPPLVGG